MNFLKILFGIILMIGSIWYYSYLQRENEDREDISPIEKSFDIEVYFGLLVFFVIGMVLVYREIFEAD